MDYGTAELLVIGRGLHRYANTANESFCLFLRERGSRKLDVDRNSLQTHSVLHSLKNMCLASAISPCLLNGKKAGVSRTYERKGRHRASAQTLYIFGKLLMRPTRLTRQTPGINHVARKKRRRQRLRCDTRHTNRNATGLTFLVRPVVSGRSVSDGMMRTEYLGLAWA
jgi:hypothetical protein